MLRSILLSTIGTIHKQHPFKARGKGGDLERQLQLKTENMRKLVVLKASAMEI
jgi:hypothetical protein